MIIPVASMTVARLAAQGRRIAPWRSRRCRARVAHRRIPMPRKATAVVVGGPGGAALERGG